MLPRSWRDVWPLLCLFGVPLIAQSENELRLGRGRAGFNGNARVPLILKTTDEVQGLVAAFGWDSSEGTGKDLVPREPLQEADTVIVRVEADFMVLGVVMNTDPNDPGSPEIIPPGEHEIATAVIQCGPGPSETTTVLSFRDGEFATVEGGVVLENVVAVGGNSIGVNEGLVLTDGSFGCDTPVSRLVIEDGRNSAVSPCGDVRILMTNDQPVEGFVTAVCHDTPELELTEIALGSAAADADFVGVEIDPFVGGTFGVVVDLVEPMGIPPRIPAGEDQHIATYRYCCTDLSVLSGPECRELRLCDGRLGEPLKDNLIVVSGLSITQAEGLALVDGEFCCLPIEFPCPPGNECCDNGIDDDGDGFIDLDDPDCAGASFLCGGLDLAADTNEDGIPDVSGQRGGSVDVCFYLRVLEDNVPGHSQFDHIQGFSMAVEYCCELSCEEELDISGTILEALEADFVSIQCDNDAADGDGCELIIGVLIEALPPFSGAAIPPLPDPQRIGCVRFQISEEAACDTTCAIEFVDGLNGRSRVPVRNLVSADNKSRPAVFFSCQVCIQERERFHRGDCNFSLVGTPPVDIADAAALVSFLFVPDLWDFVPGCMDACDCNDDGRMDLADALCILLFLFKFGNFPAPPGPGIDPVTLGSKAPGPDPTPDHLDCELGRACELEPQIIR